MDSEVDFPGSSNLVVSRKLFLVIQQVLSLPKALLIKDWAHLTHNSKANEARVVVGNITHSHMHIYHFIRGLNFVDFSECVSYLTNHLILMAWASWQIWTERQKRNLKQLSSKWSSGPATSASSRNLLQKYKLLVPTQSHSIRRPNCK